MNTTDLHQEIAAVKQEMLRVIRGKESTVDLLLNAVLAGGSVLMDDVPGVGKTTLAKALAIALNVSSRAASKEPSWALIRPLLYRVRAFPGSSRSTRLRSSMASLYRSCS